MPQWIIKCSISTLSSATHVQCLSDDEWGWRAEASSHGNPADTTAACSPTGSKASGWRRPMLQNLRKNSPFFWSFSQLNKCWKRGMSATGISNEAAQAAKKDWKTCTAQSVPEQNVPSDMLSDVPGSSLRKAQCWAGERETESNHGLEFFDIICNIPPYTLWSSNLVSI